MTNALVATLDDARTLIEKSASIVAFSGAGLSAESGVPTFRDAQTGMWARYDPTTLASPQGFEVDAELVIDWYNHRRAAVAAAQPNPAHRALGQRPDVVNVTQNVDDLLFRAGARDVVQLHGSIARDRCHSRCGCEQEIDMADPPGLRSCPECGALMRPSVVWFGEDLPPDAWERAATLCIESDLLLVIGTSAVVYPAAALIGIARESGASIIVVNTQRSAASDLADIELIAQAGDVLPQLLETQ